jgi:uncharacterized protein (DUF885 family)
MKTRYLLLGLALLSLLAAPLRAANAEFDQWAEGFAAQWARANPQFATRAQYFTGAEQDAVDRELTLEGAFGNTFGVRAAQVRAALARQGLLALAGFPDSSLSPAQRTSAAIIQWTLEDAVQGAKFARQRFVFEQFGGLHLGLVNFLTTVHPIRNPRDVQNYLARLAQVASRIDEGISEAKGAAFAGNIPPRFVLQRVIEQLNGFLAVKPADNVLVTSLDQRIAALGPAVSPEVRAKAVATAEAEVGTRILPAYARVRTMLTDQLTLANDDAGAWRLPNGAAYYASSLASLTTTSLTPAEIHEIGLREVARVEKEMETILQQLGYKDGTIQQRIEKLNATLNPPAEPDPRVEMIAKVEAIVHDAERRSADVFDLRPKAPVTVKREPAFSEKSAAAHYSPPAPDGSKPGIYWLPLADLSPRVTWLGTGLKSTAYHEAVPGHHFQIAYQQESTELPRYRKLGVFGFNSAYIEGWALYAERLAAENGWYDGDLPGKLGYLNLQLFRARRLVADTGLHNLKWTRQQVIDYGFTPAETERYIVWPGQACSYMIGQLRILELREKARAALGEKFSIKEFHNLILRGGSMPLDVLSSEVDHWIMNGGR